MTVTYSLNVANTRLCGFAKLLFRWKGSIYKLMYRELFIFMALYYSLNSLYRYGLDEKQKLIFAEISNYCQSFTKFIPLSFVLGFYVTIVVTRWWDSFKTIPWPDRCMMLVSSHLQGTDDRSRIMRRTIARYLVLLLTLTFQACSSSVKKRFPTVDHLQDAGLMTNAERIAYEKVPETHGRWWIPAQWCSCILVRARKEKRIKHDILLNQILDELYEYRGNCGFIFCYDWISIPLVYTQSVTIATYSYFLASIMARQYIDTPNTQNHTIDSYIPIFTILEFLFYMGWLKVAEQLINPFGEDDDDFELNWMLDRNLFIGLYLADEMHNQFPILVKDTYWNEEEPVLPYTKSSLNLRSKAHLGSAVNIFVGEQDAEFMPLETVMEEEKDDYVLGDNMTPDINGNYAFNYKTGQSSENVNKNDRFMYYNPKKDAPERQSLAPSQASTFLQTPVRFLSFNSKNKTRKPTNVTRSNTTSTNNSMIRLGRIMPQRKRSAGANSLGMKNAGSSTAISRVSNEDLNSLQSEALSYSNYKSTPIAFRKYSFRGQTQADDQQSLINFEKFPDLAQLNQTTSVSSSADSSTNQPMLAAYLQGNNPNSSRFSVHKSQQPSPQPHQLVSQLNQKLSQLERNGPYGPYPPYYPNYGQANYPPNYAQAYGNQADDAMSTVSTISGLQMHPIPNLAALDANKASLLERANSRASESRANETKVTIEGDDKLPPIPPQTTAIFNANNYVDNDALPKPIDALLMHATAATKESNQQPPLSTSPVPINTPLSIKIDETNDLERINEEEQIVDKRRPEENTKELVTIVEEKIEEPVSQLTSQLTNQSPSNVASPNSTLTAATAGRTEPTPTEGDPSKKTDDRLLNKKLSVDLIYEPHLVSNSSQESLSPFQSNQNTVHSFADWMEQTRNKEEDLPNKNEGA